MLHPVNVYNVNSVVNVGAGWRTPTVRLVLSFSVDFMVAVLFLGLAEFPDQLFVGIARFESRNFVIHLVLSRVS